LHVRLWNHSNFEPQANTRNHTIQKVIVLNLFSVTYSEIQPHWTILSHATNLNAQPLFNLTLNNVCFGEEETPPKYTVYGSYSVMYTICKGPQLDSLEASNCHVR
jgi:hypothetical protein